MRLRLVLGAVVSRHNNDDDNTRYGHKQQKETEHSSFLVVLIRTTEHEETNDPQQQDKQSDAQQNDQWNNNWVKSRLATAPHISAFTTYIAVAHTDITHNTHTHTRNKQMNKYMQEIHTDTIQSQTLDHCAMAYTQLIIARLYLEGVLPRGTLVVLER